MANFDVVKAIFSQVDANHDGSIDPNEFRTWAAGSGLSSSLYESSSLQPSAGELGAASTVVLSGDAGINGYQASYSSQSGLESTDGLAFGGLANAYGSSALSNEVVQSGGAVLESNSIQQTTQYASATGLFNDPNPQILRRAATGGAVTYTQKVLVKFLQPPPVPPPGPLIIREIRPPQPPPPQPLIIRQQAPPLPQPPPLILRERPPALPASVASQTVVRRLAAIPVPPRSVIIERLPPLPPKPRDIIIERWVPYGAQAKRRTIVQRAAAAKEYPKPRNLIIVYDAIQARIVRQFQRFGVTQENPQAYLARYGATLLDSSTLVQQAQAAGVVEDISPPAVATSAQFNASTSGVENGYEYASSSTGGISGVEGLQVLGGSGENYSSQSYSSSSTIGSEGDLASASIATADTNQIGSLNQGVLQSGL